MTRQASFFDENQADLPLFSESAIPVPKKVYPVASPVSVIYMTPMVKIGKHFWRAVVYFGDYGKTMRYEYLDPLSPRPCWKWHREWPTYNGDDADGGLPKSIAKLYYSHRLEIETALKSDQTSFLETENEQPDC